MLLRSVPLLSSLLSPLASSPFSSTPLRPVALLGMFLCGLHMLYIHPGAMFISRALCHECHTIVKSSAHLYKATAPMLRSPSRRDSYGATS